MAYGLDDDTIKMLRNQQAQRVQAQSVQPQTIANLNTTQTPNKGFWTDQISTAGGIGGSLGGAALGASIGSIVPGIGTAIGGLAGGIIGGALGSGGGQAVENITTGENIGEGVAKEALLGGVLSAPPIRTGKAILGATKAVATGAGKTAAKTAAEKALTEPGIIARAIGKAGQGSQNISSDLAVKQFRLNPAQTNNFKNKFGEDAGKVIQRYGFNTTEDIATKGIEPLQTQYSTLTQNIGKVSKNDVTQAFNSKITALSKSASTDNKALAKQLASERDSVLSVFGKNDAIDATNLNSIRREFDSLVNYTQKAANPARYSVNKRSADALRETLQKADTTGTLKDIGLEINKLKQLSEVASKQAELGRGSLPAGLTSLMGASAGGGVGGPVGALTGFAATKAANSATGRRAISGGADALSNALMRAGQKTVSPITPAGVIGRLGTVGIARSLANQIPSITDQTMMTSSTTPQSMTSNIGAQYQTQQDTSSQSPYSRANLLYDIQRDPQNADQYISYYQQLQEVFAPTSTTSDLSQSNQSALASADNATNTLNQLEQLYSNAGGGGGRVLGAIQNIAGTAGLNENASVYNSLAQASVTQIAKALAGSGAGTVSDADARVIIQALPTLQDSPAEAQAKFAALRQRLDAARQNTLYYGSGGTSNNDLYNSVLAAQGGY